jgi:hypothetical protein
MGRSSVSEVDTFLKQLRGKVAKLLNMLLPLAGSILLQELSDASGANIVPIPDITSRKQQIWSMHQ